MCRPKCWEYENYNEEQEGEGISHLECRSLYWANKDRSDGIGCSRDVTVMDSMKFLEKSAMG